MTNPLDNDSSSRSGASKPRRRIVGVYDRPERTTALSPAMLNGLILLILLVVVALLILLPR